MNEKMLFRLRQNVILLYDAVTSYTGAFHCFTRDYSEWHCYTVAVSEIRWTDIGMIVAESMKYE